MEYKRRLNSFFSIWLLLLTIKVLKVIHAGVWTCGSFFSNAEYDSNWVSVAQSVCSFSS